jgi:hypothetical protein
MNPEERRLLERTLKLSEENNQMLKRMRRFARWGIVWGVLKIAIIFVPIILGYLYLEPHFGPISDTWKQAQGIINTFK